MALLTLPCAAMAQDHPAPLPLRDVDVTYRVGGTSQPIEQRSRFSVGLQRMRVDLPTPGVFSLMDYRAHLMSFVVSGDKAALDTRMPAPGQPAYARLGADTVAGLPCVEWETTDTRQQAVATCITPDGVLLRARRGPQVLALAVRVAYAPQDPALFDVPAGYERVSRQAAP